MTVKTPKYVASAYAAVFFVVAMLIVVLAFAMSPDRVMTRESLIWAAAYAASFAALTWLIVYLALRVRSAQRPENTGLIAVLSVSIIAYATAWVWHLVTVRNEWFDLFITSLLLLTFALPAMIAIVITAVTIAVHETLSRTRRRGP